MIEEGNLVTLEYSAYLEDGTKIDSNVGKKPVVFRQGSQQMVPGVEEAVAGLNAGDKKRVTLPPEKLYGPVRSDAFREAEAETIPEQARRPGAQLVAEDSQGRRHQIRVHEVKDDKIVLDLNHPLAGQSLTFDLHVLKVEDA